MINQLFSYRNLTQAAVVSGLLLACGSSSNNSDNENIAGAKAQNGGAAGAGGKAGAGATNPASSGGPASAGSGNAAGTMVTVATAGTAGTAPLGTGGATGGAGDATAGTAGVAGADVTNPGTAGAAGASPIRDCGLADELRCNGNARERCGTDGLWVVLPQDQCSGTAPACTGNGICAAYRLVQGTIDTFGPYQTDSSSNYILVRQTLLEYPKACNESYCVTGGILP